jgi:hypothetical protein
VTLEPTKSKVIPLNASPDLPISFKCDIHPWMNAKCWAMDHPYIARTDEDGKFTIANVPTGVELQVVGWHEGAGYFNGGPGGKAMKLEEKNTQDFKIKAK